MNILNPRCNIPNPIVAVACLLTLLATAHADVVYVSDSSTNAGTIARIPDGGGGAPSTFASGLTRPEGLTFTPSGALYVDNQLSGEIDSVSATGTVSPFVTLSGGFVGGMISDSQGNLYVSRQHDGDIDKIAPDGTVTLYASGTATPQGLVFDSRGDLFVGSGTNNTVYKIAPGGGTAQPFATISTPVGIAIDPAGNIYATDSADGYIEKYSATGADLGQYAAVPTPEGMLFDSTGRLLVASSTRDAVGFDVYAIPAGGGPASVYASGFDGPFYLADPSVQLLLNGDANGDGNVDLSDLSIVLNHFGAADTLRADGNFDGAPTIDLTDLSDVLNNFGASTSPTRATSTPTPEPATLALLALVSPLLLRRRHRSLDR